MDIEVADETRRATPDEVQAICALAEALGYDRREVVALTLDAKLPGERGLQITVTKRVP